MMLNCDAALIKDQEIIDDVTGESDCDLDRRRQLPNLSLCPSLNPTGAANDPQNTLTYATEYSVNNDQFLDDFEAAFKKMLEWGYDDADLNQVNQ